ncbi:MAG: hypothetical protein R6U46_08920 [Marinilabilia sp.]
MGWNLPDAFSGWIRDFKPGSPEKIREGLSLSRLPGFFACQSGRPGGSHLSCFGENFRHPRFIAVLGLIMLLSFSGIRGKAQHVPVHVDNPGIYEFMDELAGTGIIELRSVIKPYSRKEIAGFLQEASDHEGLTARQREEVAFYLRDFGKELTREDPTDKRFDLFYYSDSLFRLTVNPVFGLEWTRAGDHNVYRRRNGGEFHGTIGDHFGFYGSLRDNYESELMGGRPYLVNRRGAVYKGDEEEQDYSEARGGLSWSWKWGTIGLHKDHYVWGHGYNGANLLSGNTPSHAFFSLNVKPVDWFELNYMHGWLVSEVVDSVRSFQYYDGTREVFADKFLAASLFTFKPLPRLHVSLGNSIVYADTKINPAYLNPFLFYKSVDHTYNAASNHTGQNAQMFLDVSSRQIDHLHLFSSLFVDEISINRMFDKAQHSNYVSAKAGVRVTGIPPDFVFTAEYTRTNPMVYQHIIPTTTLESNGYNMGHYLTDNSDEWFVSTRYMPVRGVKIELEYTRSRKGKDYQTILKEGDLAGHPEFNPEEPRWGLPFMNEVRWRMQKIDLKSSWQIINDGYVYLSLGYRENSGPGLDEYLPSLYREDGFEGIFGFNFGF